MKKPIEYTAKAPRAFSLRRLSVVFLLTLALVGASWADVEAPLRGMIDAPVLFTKRHSYQGIHIYDTYFKWGPGGGIYVLENPWAPRDLHRVRAVIDPTTKETLGEGMYTKPDLSFDAQRVLFCFKGGPQDSTSIYEIGIDGTGLRRLTDPSPHCIDYKGSQAGVHDVNPAYLPDGRIVFTSTRQQGLVPCANEGVDILHVMDADGSNIHTISVNNVNEFDPCVLPDGRIMHGRWEYIDKTALTQQSLWTIFPDGTNETALYANNMVHPEAVLDARPVPGLPHLIAATFAPHNSPPRGTIGIIDTRAGKNADAAISNFEYPDNPTFDRGESCEPFPLSKDVLLFSGRPQGQQFNELELISRDGRREVLYSDPEICCHSPLLLKAQPLPTAITDGAKREEDTGRFFVQDIYQGLTGVERGEVKRLRIIEETSRISATPGGALNQTFLMSAALSWSAKNFLGTVPVEPDGSAYFEVPSGRALYLQALDADGRLVQSMRTFVQAAPGVTRSCIGCHETKYSTPSNRGLRFDIMKRLPDKPQPESWGSGFVDYPSMVQPIWDKHCVACHGGEKGFAAGLDLTGGWTELFNISYENLISRRKSQVTAYLIAGIDCMNGTAPWSAPIRPPRFHGSGVAPLANILAEGHGERIENLTRTERDLAMAWIDTNGLYHGTWDYTTHGCQVKACADVKTSLIAEMEKADCMGCHKSGDSVQFEEDWFNLKDPKLSRILRAPLAKGPSGFGLARCRDRKADPANKRLRILAKGYYVHGILPTEDLAVQEPPAPIATGDPVVSFASTENPHYQAMLAIIEEGRRQALAAPRVDMPGAEVLPGDWRKLLPTRLPEPLPELWARIDERNAVHLAWERSARTLGLEAEVYRGAQPDFEPNDATRLAATQLFELTDANAPQGELHYALVFVSDGKRSAPIRAEVRVPQQ